MFAENLEQKNKKLAPFNHLTAHCPHLLFYLSSAGYLFLLWNVYIDGVGCQIYAYGSPVSLHNLAD